MVIIALARREPTLRGDWSANAQPAVVHAHEEREGQQEVHRLEHLGDGLGLAPAEVVDAVGDAAYVVVRLGWRIQDGARLARLLRVGWGLLERPVERIDVLGEGLEVPADQRREAEMLPMVVGVVAADDEVGEELRRAELPQRLLDFAELLAQLRRRFAELRLLLVQGFERRPGLRGLRVAAAVDAMRHPGERLLKRRTDPKDLVSMPARRDAGGGTRGW